MKINVDFSELARLASTINKYPVILNIDNKKVEFERVLAEDGFDVDFTDIKVVNHLLSYQEQHVLLYIKDHSYGNKYKEVQDDPKAGNRFHVAYCQTLEKMHKKNKFQRYVTTNNMTNTFKVSSSKYSHVKIEDEPKVKLIVCMNCLELLDYKESRSNRSVRAKNAAEFDLKEFFESYSTQFKQLPKRTSEDSTNYTADWAEISINLRRKSHYICNMCSVDLSSHKNLCHVHHINGVKSDNTPSNLQVLCADCHNQIHDDHMHVSVEDIEIINSLRIG